MKKRAFAFAFILLFALPLFADDYTDVIVMKNGDRMTCEIMGLQSGVLTVKLAYVDGSISVQWSQVAHLESNRLFVITTEKGAVYMGKLSNLDATGDQPASIHVATGPQPGADLTLHEIVRADRTSTQFWQRFAGEVNTGILYSKGNDSTQYNVSSDVEYQRERWSASAGFNSSLASSNNASPATRNQGDLGSLRLLPWNNWFYSGRASFLQSSVQDINLQTTVNGGIGRYFVNNNRAKFDIASGLAWQNTNYSQENNTQSSQNVGAFFVSTHLKVFIFKKTNLDLFAIALPAITQPGRVRADMTAAYYIKLFSKLSWNVSFYGDWDNQPPPGLSGSDYGTSSGLSWTFGDR
jgi:hypothetical protein